MDKHAYLQSYRFRYEEHHKHLRFSIKMLASTGNSLVFVILENRMLDMTVNNLINEFTPNIKFDDYVSNGYCPPLPPNFENPESIHGQKLVSADKERILKFILATIQQYIDYIMILYENKPQGRNAVIRFLTTNIIYVPSNIF